MQAMAPFIQISLDYVLAYFLVGFAGAFARLYAKGKDFKHKVIWIIVGTLVGGGLKFLAHFAAGYFWLNTSDSFYGIASDSMLFSFVYNGTYSFPNIILCTLIMVLLAKIAPFLLDVNYKKEEALEEEKENEVEQA
jgi:thiamine transporter